MLTGNKIPINIDLEKSGLGNNRKPAIWDKNSLRIIRKYGCKILGLEELQKM